MDLKNAIYPLFAFVLSTLFISCNDNCDCVTPPNEYYVKYEISSSTIYNGRDMEVEIKNEDGIDMDFQINQGQSWETIIGPVTRGFEATLYAVATSDTSDRLTLNARINVRKNGDPFALKGSNESEETRDNVYLSYIVE